jgi:hypothetical protein
MVGPREIQGHLLVDDLHLVGDSRSIMELILRCYLFFV